MMLRRLRSLKVVALGLLALCAVFAAEVSQALAEGFLADDEQHMLGLVNEHRSGHGAAPLQQNDALRTIARRHASRMSMAGYIYHNPDLYEEANAELPGWLSLGENVGTGPSAATVQSSFLSSQSHHSNIDAASFTIAGVGATASGSGDRYYTQAFAEYRSRPAPAAAATPQPAVRTPLPVVHVVRTPRPARRSVAAARPAATAAPTPQPTAAPTPSPEHPSPEPVAAEAPGPTPEPQPVGLVEGLVAMFARFFAKLAFWA